MHLVSIMANEKWRLQNKTESTQHKMQCVHCGTIYNRHKSLRQHVRKHKECADVYRSIGGVQKDPDDGDWLTTFPSKFEYPRHRRLAKGIVDFDELDVIVYEFLIDKWFMHRRTGRVWLFQPQEKPAWLEVDEVKERFDRKSVKTCLRCSNDPSACMFCALHCSVEACEKHQTL